MWRLMSHLFLEDLKSQTSHKYFISLCTLRMWRLMSHLFLEVVSHLSQVYVRMPESSFPSSASSSTSFSCFISATVTTGSMICPLLVCTLCTCLLRFFLCTVLKSHSTHCSFTTSSESTLSSLAAASSTIELSPLSLDSSMVELLSC